MGWNYINNMRQGVFDGKQDSSEGLKERTECEVDKNLIEIVIAPQQQAFEPIQRHCSILQ